jgi:mitochondrial fission protein ELM1
MSGGAPPRRGLCWVVTTGEAGYRSQALGLAERLGVEIEEKIIGLRPPWRWLPGHLAPAALRGLDPAKASIAPPWPDLVVSCGRRSTAVSIAIRRAAAGRTLTVHVQHPLAPASAFDLVIAQPHDGLAGANVTVVPTALHRVTEAALAEAAAAWRPRFASLPAPRVGVLLGGANRGGGFDEAAAAHLVTALGALLAREGGSVLVTPSRRTGAAVRRRFQDAFGGRADALVWDEAGDNPYLGILALADRLVVTGDSVSMISEALARRAPVEIVPIARAPRRHRLFLDDLSARGLALPFRPGPAPTTAAPVDATEIAAAAVRKLLARR